MAAVVVACMAAAVAEGSRHRVDAGAGKRSGAALSSVTMDASFTQSSLLSTGAQPTATSTRISDTFDPNYLQIWRAEQYGGWNNRHSFRESTAKK
jgi:hypothetical protein